MKTKHSNLWLTLSLLLATGCGARTPLDLEENQSASPVSGGATSQASGAGGTFASYGGSFAGGRSGGMPGVGGSYLPAGTVAGGSPTGGAAGGAVPFGGTTYGPFGGSPIVGGRGTVPFGGSGGTVPVGGTMLVGGRSTVSFGGTGGTVPFGGTTYGPFGGTIIGGRATIPFGGTVPFGGSIIGGRGGLGGTVPVGGIVPFGGGTIVGGRGSGPFGGTIVAGRGGMGGSGAMGGTGAAGGSGTGGTTCPGLDPLREVLIDNMNDGDRFIPQVNGRAGAWADSDDSTPGSTMFPDPVGPFSMTWTGDSCRQYAAYVYGGPFVDWGADFWFGLGSPYNASAYTGITFWAKIDGGTSSVVRVAFPDKDTQPDGALCQTNVTGPNQCFDHYGTRIPLTTTWTKYTVSFSSLSQDGWGRQGTAFDPSTLYEVLFEIPVNAKFGIWIDDVAFTGYFGPTPYLP